MANIIAHKSHTRIRDISVDGNHGVYTYGAVNGRNGDKGWNVYKHSTLLAYCDSHRFVACAVAADLKECAA